MRMMDRLLIAIASLLLVAAPALAQPSARIAKGTVFHDRDGDGHPDEGEEGLAGVRVSNGRDVVVTGVDGAWELAAPDEGVFFVIKPRNWMTPVTDEGLPRFYRLHKPKGSPALGHPGVPPTGPLPLSIDFPLVPSEEPDRFSVLLLGDPQPRSLREVRYIAHDVVEELHGTEAAFALTLGDLVFDNLALFEPLNAVFGSLDIPVYNVLGNHDVNRDAAHDRWSDETFERVFGPSYYSFDWGPVHFIVLDDVMWHPATTGRGAHYTSGLGPDQLEFLRNDLERVPPEQLVVLAMHIPLTETKDRAELFRLLEPRPNVVAIAAHYHYQKHIFLTEEHGWQGEQPLHLLVHATVSGSWWCGAPDEAGIPHTTMRDGAPNGTSLITFEQNKYQVRFRPSRRHEDQQLHIIAPERVTQEEAATTEVLANIYGGSSRSKVRMRLGDGPWIPMERVDRPDPWYQQAHKRDEGLERPYRPLPGPVNSPHLWRATLPANPASGWYRLEVHTVDMFGQEHRAVRLIAIR